MFQNLLPVMKIYRARDVNYRFSVLGVNFGTQLRLDSNSKAFTIKLIHIALNVQLYYVMEMCNLYK